MIKTEAASETARSSSANPPSPSTTTRTPTPAPASAVGGLPEPLEKLRAAVMASPWPPGSAVEFVANHVFVVNDKAVAERVRALLDKTHAWRNRRVVVEVGFPVLTPSVADSLGRANVPGWGAAELRGHSRALPQAIIAGRGGVRAALFVAEMHSVLARAWAPERSSPEMQVFWRGTRIAAQPHLTAGSATRLTLAVTRHALDRVAPQTIAGAVVQQPIDAVWRFDRQLRLHPTNGAHVLTGLRGGTGALNALIVSARWR